ncbi:MAG: carbamoyltransferase HypF [Xenococcaceae cyanobacterium MO_167.B27]|nr:carbamoyltransferase HypF [Xenococcaceae cyanobacterium MO_167.B27]
MVQFESKNHKTNSEIAEEIRVTGTVQGVGFRPTVYRLAKANQLRGEVSNDGQGVLIIVVGDRATIDNFIEQLQQRKPPLARITEIIRRPYQEKRDFVDFTIIKSTNNEIRTEIAPDAATCPTCRAETFDPFSRWYRYPFTNCTHCGPRLSIIKQLPYDRPQTSMAEFVMCPNCQQDYDNPLNRRFHAQPTACHVCGPRAWLERADGKPVTSQMFSMLDDVDAVATLIQRGYIIAIKGLGGFHLACDGTNEEVVAKLRTLKKRPDKPLALMARDIEVIEQYCYMNQAEKELLQSPAAPIVLLKQKNSPLAPSIAPGHNYLGFMLPYTPLHHLIFKRLNIPIVLTSGNLADEPQCINNEDAKKKLTGIADYFLFHNREIVNRVDDSVVRVLPNFSFGRKPCTDTLSMQILRRARGYAPAPINLPAGFENIPPILAMGSELKNTFCLLRDGQAILSQHIGDLENLAAWESYRNTLNLYLGLLEHQPNAVAVDLHPEYLATKQGKELAAANSLPIYSIQHHHAHIAACMVENGLPLDTQPVLGIALDGLGYGEDGTFWGGEFLLADYRSYKRLGTFKPVAMLGGEQAIYQPWRSTYAHLQSAFAEDRTSPQPSPPPSIPPNPPLSPLLGGKTEEEFFYIGEDRGITFLHWRGSLDLFEFLRQKPLKLLDQMAEKGINSPLASSCGRLFDAVAAAIGICRESCSYEGQAAIALEALAEQWILNHPEEIAVYSFAVENKEVQGESNLLYLEPRPMWEELLADLQEGISKPAMAAKFHRGLARAIAVMVEKIRSNYTEASISQVALTGGVFQNQILLLEVSNLLQEMGITVLTHSQVPPNDGGLSLGQVALAASQLSVNSEQ